MTASQHYPVRIAAFALLACAVLMGVAPADTTITIGAEAAGHYQANGNHSASEPDYSISGSGASEFRGFFVFDLPALDGTVTSGFLIYKAFGVTGAGSLSLYDINTPTATLLADHSGATGIFNDVGSGNLYGLRPNFLGVIDNNNSLMIPFPFPAALTDLNAHLGSTFAIGVTCGNNSTYFTGATGSLASNVQLKLTYTPEPSGLALLTVLPLLMRRYRASN